MTARPAAPTRSAFSPLRPTLRPIALSLCALALSASACSRGGADGNEGNRDGSARSDAAIELGDAAMPGGGDGPLVDPRDLRGAPVDLGPDLSGSSADPFDPASCADPALTAAQALAKLGAGSRLKLADATLYRRSRTCTGMTCGPWGTPVVHQQALLTYSGGAVTDYKTFSFPTHLILFLSSGQPKLSVRHESDYRHDATADKRGVVFSFGMDPMENTYPVIYVWDFAPKPNRYDDLQGLLGSKGQLRAAERCARVVFTEGLTTEIAAVYRY